MLSLYILHQSSFAEYEKGRLLHSSIQTNAVKSEHKQTFSCRRECVLTPLLFSTHLKTSVLSTLTSLCSFLHLSAVTISWLGRVGMVSDLMTLGGGGGALNKPSSFWELLSLLLLDKMA